MIASKSACVFRAISCACLAAREATLSAALASALNFALVSALSKVIVAGNKDFALVLTCELGFGAEFTGTVEAAFGAELAETVATAFLL
jgi:hypothetical protein